MSEYTLQHNCYIFGREASIHSTKNTLAIAFVQEYSYFNLRCQIKASRVRDKTERRYG